jgi:hypothetical protein
MIVSSTTRMPIETINSVRVKPAGRRRPEVGDLC